MSVEYVRIAKVQELSDRRGKLVKIEDEEITLFKVDGKVYALNNVCAHQHFSALHQGELNGLRISCPMHGWMYSLETGIAESGEGRVKVYPVRVDGNDVYVGLREDDDEMS